jgi:hypothetical protein
VGNVLDLKMGFMTFLNKNV